ncbi:MAG: glycoside hydrolase family 15 protein [Verrucomicrobiota bacterium]
MTFHQLPIEERIKASYQQLERMRRPNGGYVASPYNAEDGSGDAYNVFWIRDIMFATYANEYLGCFDRMVESFRLVLDIFKKFHPRIVQASIIKPDVRHQTGQFMPARVHPTTLDTITDAWGHHQLDVYGLFMYKMGDLIKKGYGFRFTHEDFTLISHMRNYVFNMGFEADYGMWEEGPEEHSSSFGAVLGGLMMWFDQGFYDFKYKHKIQISHYVPVSERMIADGFSALSRILPRESPGRPFDLAQLSLIWPYNIVDFDVKKEILGNIETHLVGERGVRRYPGDVYCGKGLVAGRDEAAQWPLGLAWLAICYAKFAEYGRDFDVAHQPIHFNWDERQDYFNRAVSYFAQLERCMTPEGHVPEMYVREQPGHNTPLAWAQSFHVVSAQLLLNLAHEHPQHFKLPSAVRRGEELSPQILAA